MLKKSKLVKVNMNSYLSEPTDRKVSLLQIKYSFYF